MFKSLIVTGPDCAGPDCAGSDSVGPDCAGLDPTGTKFYGAEGIRRLVLLCINITSGGLQGLLWLEYRYWPYDLL
jgi:hypothetical protein